MNESTDKSLSLNAPAECRKWSQWNQSYFSQMTNHLRRAMVLVLAKGHRLGTCRFHVKMSETATTATVASNEPAKNFHLISYARNGDGTSFSNTLPSGPPHIWAHLVMYMHLYYIKASGLSDARSCGERVHHIFTAVHRRLPYSAIIASLSCALVKVVEPAIKKLFKICKHYIRWTRTIRMEV